MDSVGMAKEMVNASGHDQDNVQLCIEHGVTMADLFCAVLMESSGIEHFDAEMTEFLDDVAGTIGDFIGAACGDPKAVIFRFGEVLMGAAADRIDNKELTCAPHNERNEMTPDERIDAALDSVLRASGSALKYYTMQKTLDRMREAMRKVMSDSYIAGSNANFEAMTKARDNVEFSGQAASPRSSAGTKG